MNRSTSYEDRTPQHTVLLEKRRQALAHIRLARGLRDADNIGDGRREKRPLTPFDCSRRSYRTERHFVDRQCSDSDDVLDDALSEYAADYYTPRRPSRMRLSTLKKLNRLFDGMSTPLANSSHVHSAPEVTDDEGQRTPMERTPETDPQEKAPVEATPNASSESPKLAVTVNEPIAPVQPTHRPSRSSTVGMWCLRKLMTVLLLLFELMLQLTIKVLEFVRDQLYKALRTLWDHSMSPLLYQGFRERLSKINPKSIVLVIVIAPLVALLAMAYCAVCALYWLNRVLLMEAHPPWLSEMLPDPDQQRADHEEE
uniref:Uncharacterized protein n=1 Tax=Anopheles atroparvus TaxID=41427 RepID=A0A182JN85_ANOAO